MKPDLTRPVDFTTYNGTDKICTRHGKPWRMLGEIKSRIFPKAIAGTMFHPNGFETVYVWNAKGRMDDREERGDDFFYALPEKVEKTFWIVVSEEEINSNRIECILYPNREKIGSISISSQIVPITLLVEE